MTVADDRGTHSEQLHDTHQSYVDQLTASAVAFLYVGIGNYDWAAEEADSGGAQAAIANLTIATELLAKAFLAERDLSLVIANPTLAMRALCACPDSLPADFRAREHLDAALFDSSKTKEFDEVLQGVYLFLPAVKTELEFALKRFRIYRNTALHSAIREFDPFRGLLVAWATLKFFKAVSATGLRFDGDELPERGLKIIADFETARMTRLSGSIERAQKVAENLPVEVFTPELADPTRAILESCPVCGRPAVLNGETETDLDDDYFDEWGLRPTPIVGFFHAQALTCPTCGLRLDGELELRELGLNTVFDVTQQLAVWAAEHDDSEDVEESQSLDGLEGLD